MSKNKKTPLGIFMEAIKLYFSNFDKFIKYMSFPVLGQIGGLLLVFLTTYFYSQNLPALIERNPALNNYSTLTLLSILVTLPGLAIFTKAFWEYLVAYGAINSMLDNMLKSGKVYDFDAHTDLITRRSIPYIGLWFLLGIFSIIAICPLFWVICAIFAVYFVLVFQVFTFEPELSPIGCIKQSFLLIKRHFAHTFLLLTLMGTLTYILFPEGINKIFEITGSSNFIAKNFLLPFINQLQIPNLSTYRISITGNDIALFTVKTFIAQIIIQYTLPLRAILWSLWYKNLNKGVGINSTDSKVTKSSKKRPSEKLMEASNKKYGKKKLDRNILKRASEKEG